MKPSETHVGLILALTVNGLAVSNYPDMVTVSQSAEQYGFDSVWLCDHFLTISPDDYVKDAGIAADSGRGPSANPISMPLLECWTALTALARDTTRLRLGTSVLCNSYRHPAVLAKMAATLDVISEGRLDLGLGAGWFQREFEAYGIPFPPVRDRVSALDEALQVIRAVWTEPNPTYSGQFYTLDGAICDPPPVQRPHPPLWIGGEGDRVHRIAARHAQGLNVRWWSPLQVTQRRDFLARACESAGRAPESLRLSVTALLAPTESAEDESRIRAEFASIPESGLIVGSPERCLARIREYQDCGVGQFLFTVPHVVKSDYLHVIGRDILPAIKCTS
ncbi:TIGR03619 family F420-dependent LLM class oxidoreductase [Mycobacterium angelicum]|uniref:LLM class F420-dependent oxidoreductase n=1 Tax=Mycobacterium angelicum TaxID=470074 RepID=A0A1X0A3I8_MYCAN|nr:TIGR03619 family F420-dependent LLM class oxidoreductase [Mycobacterium angelicum]MCV7197980.1 LLM class flavin-dependent oxidoreductase [Mycobacterium angelicum]ORA24653.1 LLM class F420-dependent oxidoreductase [Mycobacterium angelicum]